MSTASPDAPRVTLAVGPETVLAERAVAQVVAAVRAELPQAQRYVIDASDDGAASEIAAALSPTLFGDPAVVVVWGLDKADAATGALLSAAAADPPPDVWLVLIHPGGAQATRSRAGGSTGSAKVTTSKATTARQARSAGGPTGAALLVTLRTHHPVEVDCPALKKRRDLTDRLAVEVRALQRRITPQALDSLIDAVGADLRMLLSATAQLVSDVETDPIGVADVSRYFGGVAEVSGFAISDAVWDRSSEAALRDLRWAAESHDGGRVGPATVGALATGLRALVRYAGAPRGVPEGQIAADVGVPPWKLRSLRAQLNRWRPDELARAVTYLAEADAAVKGGVYEGDQLDAEQKLWAMDRLVLGLSRRESSAD